MTFLAGDSAFAINVSISSLYPTKSTFSPFSSFRILPILEPFSPIQAPIGSILSLSLNTATLLLSPASLATLYNVMSPFANSGISDSNNLLTKP